MRTSTPLLALICLIACTSLHAQLPQGIQMDGSLSFAEMSDTVHFRQAGTGTTDIFLKKSASHYYINVHSSTIANILVIRRDTLWVIHASGSVGSAMYRKIQSDSFVPVKTLLPVNEQPSSWDMVGPFVSKRFLNLDKNEQQTRTDIAACLQKNRYTATSFDMGSRYDFEFLFTKQFLQNSRILVSYTDHAFSKKQFPAQAVFTGDTRKDEQIYNGSMHIAGNIAVSAAGWFSID